MEILPNIVCHSYSVNGVATAIDTPGFTIILSVNQMMFTVGVLAATSIIEICTKSYIFSVGVSTITTGNDAEGQESGLKCRGAERSTRILSHYFTITPPASVNSL